jgi:hypothetical protein
LALAAQVAPAAAGPAPPVVEVRGTLQTPFPIDALEAQGGADRPGPAPVADSQPCQAAYFHPDAPARAFRFQEDRGRPGCLGVTHNQSLPAGVRRVTVQFEANRSVAQEALQGSQPPAAFDQELRLWADGRLVAAVPYFRPDEGARARAAFAIDVALPERSDRLQLEWWFADHGALSVWGGVPAARAPATFGATVWQPSLRIEDALLDRPAPEAHAAGYLVRVEAPWEMRDAATAGLLSLDVAVPAPFAVARLAAADGTALAAEHFTVNEAEGARTLHLPAATLRAFGPGPYALELQPPAAAPPAPPGVTALAVLALGLPAIALLLCLHQFLSSGRSDPPREEPSAGA